MRQKLALELLSRTTDVANTYKSGLPVYSSRITGPYPGYFSSIFLLLCIPFRQIVTFGNRTTSFEFKFGFIEAGYLKKLIAHLAIILREYVIPQIIIRNQIHLRHLPNFRLRISRCFVFSMFENLLTDVTTTSWSCICKICLETYYFRHY